MHNCTHVHIYIQQISYKLLKCRTHNFYLENLVIIMHCQKNLIVSGTLQIFHPDSGDKNTI